MFNELKEDELLSTLRENKHPQEQKGLKNYGVHRRRFARIARVLLDSSVSVEYPDWITEDSKDTKHASVTEEDSRHHKITLISIF